MQTSVGGQTNTQQFCYDDLSRLTWSGTNGTPPCSGTSITAGTLTGAQYQQSTTYSIESGLVSGPAGSYNYGDSAHPHAVTSTSNGYSATYDAAGNLICRALTMTTTCSGTSPSGQQLSYDAQGRLSIWQDHITGPTQTVNYLYDGSGSRVAMQSTASGATTLTSYIGSIEEVQTTGSTTQTTTYYAVGSKRVAADVNGTFYYFGYDALGSQVAVLDAAGSLVGAQLYGPYGSSRYNTGTLPTSIGFTGQRADSVTELDYYNARYYDPSVGQFLSVDSVQGNEQGMDPYAYVGGNPESRTDPTGNNCYDPTTDTVKVGCGNPNRTQPGSSTPTAPTNTGSGSGTTTTQPNPPSPPARPVSTAKPKHGPKIDGKPTSVRKNGKPTSAQKKTPADPKDGIKNPGLFATGVAQLLGGAIALGAIIGLATQPGGALVEKVGWPIIAAIASYALRLAINGIRDMFEALDQVNKAALVMLDMVQLALDIDIAVFTSADIVFHLATLGTLGEVVDANASLIRTISAGIATKDGMAEVMTMMGDTMGIVSGGAALNIQGDWQQLQADNR